MNKKFLIIIAGPTAIGKTDLAIRLAHFFNTEIINADSRQLYREMKIGTAVPSLQQQKEIKHHFINYLSIHEYYNASRFETEVIELLDEWYKSKDIMIMAGGSGMYIDAVCKGIDDIPTVTPDIRRKIRIEYQTEGLEAIRDRLQQVDPVYYSKADLNNPQRIMKALEIAKMTGRPYSSFLTGKAKKRTFQNIKLGLNMPRSELHLRINNRVDAMMSEGLLEEVSGLYPYRHLNALKTVGYREIFDYLDGKCTLEESVEAIKGHTRQYARRQLTWFRKDKDFTWFHPDEYESILAYLTHPVGVARFSK
jgi:tRNA dimethylallyltransferase